MRSSSCWSRRCRTRIRWNPMDNSQDSPAGQPDQGHRLERPARQDAGVRAVAAERGHGQQPVEQGHLRPDRRGRTNHRHGGQGSIADGKIKLHIGEATVSMNNVSRDSTGRDGNSRPDRCLNEQPSRKEINMGLASALSTALTGLTAAETTIDVVGNNLANSNTVGFKASTANFATQFLQTPQPRLRRRPTAAAAPIPARSAWARWSPTSRPTSARDDRNQFQSHRHGHPGRRLLHRPRAAAANSSTPATACSR